MEIENEMRFWGIFTLVLMPGFYFLENSIVGYCLALFGVALLTAFLSREDV